MNCGQNTEFLNVKAGGKLCKSLALKGYVSQSLQIQLNKL